MIKNTVKKLLSRSVILKLKVANEFLDNIIYPVMAKSRFLSSLYYCFYNSQFKRENQSVLQARLQYKKSLNDIEKSSALLRRNTHRLEKGLIMQPRKGVFAEDYIFETVLCFKKCSEVERFCVEELQWANDVLTLYFSVVSSSEIIDSAKNKFNDVELHQKSSHSKNIPYLEQQRIKSAISPEELFTLYKHRRSVRWYEETTVEMSVIEQAVEMAAQAPSACNRQPFQFYTILDSKKASEVSSIPMGTKGFSDNIPALIAIVGDLSAYPHERDRHVIYIDGGLVAMQLMLAFETLGLSTCPINWPDMEDYEVLLAKKLDLPVYLRPIMMMAVGYAKKDGGIPYSQKKTPRQLIKVVS